MSDELRSKDIHSEESEDNSHLSLASSSGENSSAVKRKKKKSLEIFGDVPLNIAVMLGNSKLNLRELLSLTEGSVIELSKVAGEPLDILINQRLVSRGEVLVTNTDKYAIRLTDIIDLDGENSKKG